MKRLESLKASLKGQVLFVRRDEFQSKLAIIIIVHLHGKSSHGFEREALNSAQRGKEGLYVVEESMATYQPWNSRL